MPEGVITLRISGGEPGDLDARLRKGGPDHASRVTRLIPELSKLLLRSSKIYLRVDSSTPIAATDTVACTQASATDGDTLRISVPGYQSVVLTAKSSGAVAANGEFNIGASDTAMADNLRDTINTVKGLKGLVTATATTGTVTLTSVRLGTVGNGIQLSATVSSGTPFGTMPSTFSGGLDVLTTSSLTATITHASIVSGTDTLNIGNVALVYESSPVDENDIQIGSDNATSAANMATAINAHSKLQGIVSASAASGVVTITWLGAGREAALIGLSEAGSGIVLSATTLAPGTTDAYEGDGSLV